MRRELTDVFIKSAIKDATKRFELSDIKAVGLRLRISAGGRTVWVLAVKDPSGVARRFRLGEYPTLSLKKAREDARTLKAEVVKGKDPVEEGRQRRAWGVNAKQGIGTLGALLIAYGQSEHGKKKSWPMSEYRIRHVFARHVDQPLEKLTAKALQATAQAHGGVYAAAAAVRALRPVLKRAVGPYQVDPAVAAFPPPAAPKRRERVLSKDEVARLVPALRRGGAHHRAMLFMLLTLARREEVGGAVWGQIDLARGEWTIPESQTKNSKPHTVPLSKQAVALLGDAGKPDAFVFATETGGRLSNWDRAATQVMKITEVISWTRHDLRRTGATMLGEAMVAPYVIEAALNHVNLHSSLAAIYNKARYRPAVRVALQNLADEIDGLVGAPAPDAAEGAGAGAVGSDDSGADGRRGEADEVVHEGIEADQGPGA